MSSFSHWLSVTIIDYESAKSSEWFYGSMLANTACTRRLGVCAFSGSLLGLKLVPTNWYYLSPPSRRVTRAVSPHFAVKHLKKKVVTKKSFKIKAIVSIVVLVCLGLVVVETQTNVLHHTIDNFVYDNKNHYLSCAQLPTEAEVRTIVQEHQDVIQAIEQVNPGFVGVEIETSCADKADLLIWYGTHGDRLEIEAILGEDTFFGIPYRLNNR